jgi:hypothetical protein
MAWIALLTLKANCMAHLFAERMVPLTVQTLTVNDTTEPMKGRIDGGLAAGPIPKTCVAPRHPWLTRPSALTTKSTKSTKKSHRTLRFRPSLSTRTLKLSSRPRRRFMAFR